MKITIIGTGYVGLVSGACLADVGNQVLCLDLDQRKIEILKSGSIPIYEPGLKEIVANNIAAGRLRFTTDIAESVAWGDVQFIAVGTPPGEDGSADLQYVVAAARNIGRYMSSAKIVVDKSTVPVLRAAATTYCRSAEPSSPGGVPTAMNCTSPQATLSAISVVNFKRPAAILLATISFKPGS